MNYVSLFSGIGGLDLGLDRANMRCVAQVEKDEYCRRVLAKHWPDVPRFEDVREFGRDSINGTVSLIAGGFPCQPFSNAGKRRGADDDRHLWPEMLRIVQEFKPRWVLGENVPGIIPLFLDQALIDLEAEGYEAWALVLPAVAFDAPHIRQRLFIVAYSKSGGCRERGEGRFIGEGAGVQEQNGKVSSLAYAASIRWDEKQAEKCKSDSGGGRLQRAPRGCNSNGDPAKWIPEPRVGRVATGVSNRVDRLRALGNAVVPQVAQFLGELIMEADQR